MVKILLIIGYIVLLANVQVSSHKVMRYRDGDDFSGISLGEYDEIDDSYFIKKD